MSKFAVGDRVEIVVHQNGKYMGKIGKVMFIGNNPKSVSQPVDIYLPTMESEPYYSISLDNDGEVHNLKEKQLRKLPLE